MAVAIRQVIERAVLSQPLRNLNRMRKTPGHTEFGDLEIRCGLKNHETVDTGCDDGDCLGGGDGGLITKCGGLIGLSGLSGLSGTVEINFLGDLVDLSLDAIDDLHGTLCLGLWVGLDAVDCDQRILLVN